MPRLSRAFFLLQVLLGLEAVRLAARLLGAAVLSAASGLAIALLALATAPRERGPTVPIAAGVIAAGLTGGILQILALRATRRTQAAEFSRLARRLGEEKAGRSDLKSALRRLAAAIDTAIPQVFAQNEEPNEDLPAAGRSRIGGRTRRLHRLGRAAGLLGGTDLELKRVALAGPCAEVIEEYRKPAGPAREILYIEDGGGDWLSAPVDRPLLVLLLRELLDNVLAHAKAWGRITVTTEPVAGAIVLRVRDDGRGIPAESRSAPPAALDSSTRGGLGLLLVRAIVEAHGGSFRIESQPGHGTSVTLRFPAPL